MQIHIIQVGKTKHKFIQEAELEYQKRLRQFADLKITTIKEFSVGNSSHQAQREKAKAEEAKAILKTINTHSSTFLIVLDEHGKQLTSLDFAHQLEEIRDFQGGNITFIIGGPFGLSKEIKSRANLLLSFSRFTFTHEQIRLLLLEQLYRGSTILAHKTYHY